jgi:hypothetical protein
MSDRSGAPVMTQRIHFVAALLARGVSGFILSKSRQGRLVAAKMRRMPFIAANGVLILVPCAIFLN